MGGGGQNIGQCDEVNRVWFCFFVFFHVIKKLSVTVDMDMDGKRDVEVFTVGILQKSIFCK